MVLKCDMEVHASSPLGSDAVLGSVVLEDSKRCLMYSGVLKCETMLQIWDRLNFGILKTETHNGKE